MLMDAEQRQADLVGLNETDVLLFNVREDPRNTSAECWLQRHSLNELPQPISVLAGDMWVVMSRRALPEEAALYGTHVRRRLRVNPGISGMWRVTRDPTCPSTKLSVSMCVTSRTGRSSLTCRSSGKPSRRCYA